MKRSAGPLPSTTFPLVRRKRFAGLVALLAASGAFGQVRAPAPAPAPYVDRVIDASTLTDDSGDAKVGAYNSAGWPRTWRVDYSLISEKSASTMRSHAVGIGGFVDTPNWGAWSLNANLVRQQSDAEGGEMRSTGNGGSTWRIDQRGLPLDGGWFANHSAGDINTGSTRLARGLGRITLPTSPIRGLGGQWFQGDSADFNAAAGRTGLFSGFNVTGFEPTHGSVASAGAQFRLPARLAGGRSDVAFQLIEGRDIPGINNSQNTRGVWAATAWEGAAPWAGGMAPGSMSPSARVGGLRLQGNVVQTSATAGGAARGFWADAAWRGERWRNTAGVFRLDPNLRWGAVSLPSDLQGVYWQADTSTRQWQAGFTAEFSDSVSHGAQGVGAPGRSAFLNLNGNYRLDTRNSVGAALSLRTLTSPGQALLLSWNRISDWGQTQLRSDIANTGGSRTLRVGVDQSWPVAQPASFNTSLAREQVTGGPAPGGGWIWGVLGNVSPWTTWSQWSLDAALRGARRSNGESSLNANVGVLWQPVYGWSLALRYTQSRGQEPLQPLVVSGLTAATLQTLPLLLTHRSVQLLLRYEGRAGASTAPLGGLPGTGAGGLSGAVFFDTDANGRREASEAGVPGVSVTLDRRYVTRTDAQGRYDFPFVAAGPHLIEVSADNVPLPWSPALREPVAVTVLVRQQTTFDFAVQRDR